MKLLVVSHVPHYTQAGRLHAYGPYAREIDLWAQIFDHVQIASPLSKEAPPGYCLPLSANNISMIPQLELGGESWAAKLRLIAGAPLMIASLSWAMFRAEAIHVRCPGNLGLLGVLLAPLFRRPRVAKYAAQWSGTVSEPFSYRLQRRILGSWWWRAPVTVYGHWPNQPAHVIPFFTSLLSQEHLERGRRALNEARPHDDLRVLFTGRLSKSKNVDILLQAVACARAKGHDIKCRIIGEGPEQSGLEALTEQLQLREHVEFTGGLEFESVLKFLGDADVLVLASETEGWPKSVAEGMAFGLVCIGSNRGLVPEMLADGRGLLVEPGDIAALTERLVDIANAPEAYHSMRVKAAHWAQQFSIEKLRDAVRSLLEQQWRVSLRPREDLIDTVIDG